MVIFNQQPLSKKGTKDVQVTNIIPHLTTKNTWYTDDSMNIVFGMTVTWQDPGVSMTSKVNYTTESMDKYFDAKLEYINGEFKIMDSDVKLFDTVALLNSVSDDF